MGETKNRPDILQEFVSYRVDMNSIPYKEKNKEKDRLEKLERFKQKQLERQK